MPPKNPLSRSSTTPLLPTDLNPQHLKKGSGIEYLAESSKSRRARQKAVGMVNKIGRALSLTKSKSSEVQPPVQERRTISHPIVARDGWESRLKPLKPNFTGPIMAPLKPGEEVSEQSKTGERVQRASRPSLPLRSRQSWHTESLLKKPQTLAVQPKRTQQNPLYKNQWNHSREALSLFDVPLSTSTKPSHNIDNDGSPYASKHHRAQQGTHQSAPRLTRSTLGERTMNSDHHDFSGHDHDHPPEKIFLEYSTDAMTFRDDTTPPPRRTLPIPPLSENTPKQHRREPVSFNYTSDSFESLINVTTPKSVKTVGSWQPLKIDRRPVSVILDRELRDVGNSGNIETPPTPNFGIFPHSNPPPSPLPSLDHSFTNYRDGTQSHSQISLLSPEIEAFEDEPENSYEQGQGDLYDEVLTSWNLPPFSISRANSLVIDRLHGSSHQPIPTLDEDDQRDKLSKSTGFLDFRPNRYKVSKDVIPLPAFYPSGRSFEPIRSARSNDMLNIHSDQKGLKEGEEKRRMSGRVRRAVEAFEGRVHRDLSESPPTPWKEMARLLQREQSASSLSLQEETKQMMSEAREKKHKPRPKSYQSDSWFGSFRKVR